MFYHIISYYTILCYIVLYIIIICQIIFYIVLKRIIFCCIVLYCIVLHCIALRCVALRCVVSYCIISYHIFMLYCIISYFITHTFMSINRTKYTRSKHHNRGRSLSGISFLWKHQTCERLNDACVWQICFRRNRFPMHGRLDCNRWSGSTGIHFRLNTLTNCLNPAEHWIHNRAVLSCRWHE